MRMEVYYSARAIWSDGTQRRAVTSASPAAAWRDMAAQCHGSRLDDDDADSADYPSCALLAYIFIFSCSRAANDVRVFGCDGFEFLFRMRGAAYANDGYTCVCVWSVCFPASYTWLELRIYCRNTMPAMANDDVADDMVRAKTSRLVHRPYISATRSRVRCVCV